MFRATELRDYVGQCASLAALLEVSASPKPGNVHRLKDFKETTYEHFLASSVAISPYMGEIAYRAYRFVRGKSRRSKIGIGEQIFNASKQMFEWQSGGNVHLGTILLFSPISAAMGISFRNNGITSTQLRNSLIEVMKLTDSSDTINIYRTIAMSMSKENLGKSETLDITNPDSIEKIRKENTLPKDVFKLCETRDSICSEWITDFKITFEDGYPYLVSQLKNNNVNKSIVNTFLMILSRYPDSLVARKSGLKNAENLMKKAKAILNAGGASTNEGMKMLVKLDEKLQNTKGLMNPGTTADLTAASIFVNLLTGWRP